MEKFELYKGDLSGECGNLRACGEESSDDVVSHWMHDDDPYEVEKVSLDSGDPASIQYYSLTGERVVLRRKVLGLSVDAAFESDVNLLAAHPFVGSDCTVAELLDAKVRVAMAFVPLTSDDGVSGAVLARLYCVSGLKREFPIPFDSKVPLGAKDYSWFLAGCRKQPSPAHESWHLAAYLLMAVLRDSNTHACQNLATSFVVTGTVDQDTGRICPVLMGRKTDVVNSELCKLIWLMPKANEKEVTKMIKIECPTDLSEAYELIKTMQNHATKALVGAAESGTSAGTAIVELLKCNADPAQSDKHTKNARQLFALSSEYKVIALVDRIQKTLAERGVAADMIDDLIEPLYAEMDKAAEYARTLSYYGGIPQMFFMLSRRGDAAVVKLLSGVFDINSTDEKGETALDFAKAVNEPSAASILVQCGATRRGIYEPSCERMQGAILALALNKVGEETTTYICEALDNGCSPNAVLELNNNAYRESSWEHSAILAQSADDLDPFGNDDRRFYAHRRRRYSTTLFLEALYAGNIEVIEACMTHGGNTNVAVLTAAAEKMSRDVFYNSGKPTVSYHPDFTEEDFLARVSTPISVLTGEFSDKVQKLLKKYEKMGSGYVDSVSVHGK